MAMKKESKMVFEFLQKNNDADMTAQDIADALGLPKKQVDGIFTAAIQRKNYGVRIPAEIELEDGTHKTVKFLHLTDEGMSFNLEAAEEAK